MPNLILRGTAERTVETNWIFDLKWSQHYCLGYCSVTYLLTYLLHGAESF